MGVVVPGKRLTVGQRATIERMWAAGRTQALIAEAVGVHPSTVSREVARNGGGGYGPRHPLRRGPKGRLRAAYRLRYSARDAHRRAALRARRPRVGKLAAVGWLRSFVVARLRRRWSPGQIAGRLRLLYPHQPERWVSAEAIYLAIYLQARGGLKELVEGRALRSGRVNRRPARPAGTRARFADLPRLADRPVDAADRAVLGHFEGDLVIGAGCRSGIATVVERKSRYAILVALPDRGFHRPDTVADAIAHHMHHVPRELRRSLAWDRGLEMVHSHARFTIATGCQVYFADPHSPWQRGTNENTNGLIRQYYPKGKTDFDNVSQADLDTTARELNNRPRACLGFRTPAEVFNEELQNRATTG